MKKMKLKSVLFVLVATMSLLSCSNDDDNKTSTEITKTAYVTAIQGPATIKAGNETSFDIVFTQENSCGEFDAFIETEVSKVEGLKVGVKYPTTPCAQQVPLTRIAVYKFKRNMKGTYELRFLKSEAEFLTKTVVVE